ncbi:Protein of unknown function (DUF3176) domain containing protein [Rhypophila decipiens]
MQRAPQSGDLRMAMPTLAESPANLATHSPLHASRQYESGPGPGREAQVTGCNLIQHQDIGRLGIDRTQIESPTSQGSSTADTGAAAAAAAELPTHPVNQPTQTNNETANTPPGRWKWIRHFEVAEGYWAPELMAVVFAILVLLAIVILLAVRKDREQPAWPSLLNINTLLSILTTLFKTALLFPVVEGIGELKWIRFSIPHPVRDIDRWDAATRSPWGSFKLIIKHPRNLLTSLGAGVIILSIAVDPFAQQALEFYSCQRPAEGAPAATIARTNNYTHFNIGLALGSPVTEKPMTVALYKGLLDPPPNASFMISVFCPSGNCTFGGGQDTETPYYTSLAMCSSVHDISGYIQSNGTGDWDIWDYSLPSGFRITGSGRIMGTKELKYPDDLEEENEFMFAFELLMVSLNCTDPEIQSRESCSTGSRAFNVTLAPCVHRYGNASSSDGVFDEHLLSTTLLPMAPGSRGMYYSLAGDYPPIGGTDCSPSSTPQDRKIQPTAILGSGRRYALHFGESEQSVAYYDPECVYEVGYQEWTGLNFALAGFFGSKDDPENTNGLADPRGIDHQILGDEWLLSLWQNGRANITSVTSFVNGLTWTITAAMREGGHTSNSQPVLGKIYEGRTCVGVDWLWFIYPVVLMGLTLVFVLLTIYRTRQFTRPGGEQGGRGPWKSSMLPVLWCGGISDSMRSRAHELGSIKQMNNYSDTVQARLERETVSSALEEGVGVGGKSGRWILREC